MLRTLNVHRDWRLNNTYNMMMINDSVTKLCHGDHVTDLRVSCQKTPDKSERDTQQTP